MNKNWIWISFYPWILVFLLAVSCGRQKTEWQEVVEEEDGVTVVHNPGGPYYGDLALELEEDLSIGTEEDDNYLFNRIREITVDSENNIYAVDMGNYRVQKFDKTGRYLRTIGRKGQGPGEFSGPVGLFIDSQQSLYVKEYRKIQRFDPEGEFIDSIPLDYYLADFAIDDAGCLLGYADLQPIDKAVRAIVKMDPQGKMIKKIAEYADLGIKIIVGENATFTLSPNHSYSAFLQFCSLGPNIYAYGYPSEYLIHLIDKEGKPLLKIRKEETPLSITREEKGFIIKSTIGALERNKLPISKKTVEETLHFEKYRAYFDNLLSDDKERLYVRRVKSVLDEGPGFEFDVFNREGYYLYKVRLPFSPEVIRDGCLYDVYASEETGEVKIKRYRIKNWDTIKTGI
jgi:hypothetical protein